jgi:hypothetical protein
MELMNITTVSDNNGINVNNANNGSNGICEINESSGNNAINEINEHGDISGISEPNGNSRPNEINVSVLLGTSFLSSSRLHRPAVWALMPRP